MPFRGSRKPLCTHVRWSGGRQAPGLGIVRFATLSFPSAARNRRVESPEEPAGLVQSARGHTRNSTLLCAAPAGIRTRIARSTSVLMLYRDSYYNEDCENPENDAVDSLQIAPAW